ncbi:histone-lysine N-methyltransferase SETDB2 [Solea solea]|uniref:histone-lysine N-methyltransferase SETDB2 n=1 Tax=Solea solea TaxID=90069 RepID=UPI0027295806|nr:histone-lysine N-methyltransferase SETDB2 [Solea solea]
METEASDSHDVERAQRFWAEQDLDLVFSSVSSYLDHLKRVLNKNTATDKELVQALKLLECLDLCPSVPAQDLCPSVPARDQSVVQVVIGADELQPDSSHHSPSPPPAASNGVSGPAAPPADRQQPLPPLVAAHTCSKTCLPSLPSMPQSTPPFWGQNPLMVPLLCGFTRLSATPSPRSGGAEPTLPEDVVYRAPCGKSLCNHDDVMQFLLGTETYDVLQVDFFTFNPTVQLDPPTPAGPRRPELDLSRGTEPTPVELCPGDDGALPADFRYRRDRWPHGCFLSRGPLLFNACCDCTDGCGDARRCACAALTRGGRHYAHHRLTQPVPSGVYECGPWCGCNRARCQNRVVQRGIRVRLQVFQTVDRGWGVRCRDDLERGTFVCIYAGLILQRVAAPAEPPPPKLVRCDLPSDDEVEVVTEWLAPPVLEARSNLVETPPTSPPLHVPVIQRPSDAGAQTLGPAAPAPPSGHISTNMADGGDRSDPWKRGVKRVAAPDHVYFLDASREGNVSRFFNHSCQSNLFIQNVFIDCHDPAFPVPAFFTSSVVKAGSELTWNYCDDALTSSLQKQEVACLCGSDGCRGNFIIEDNLCDMCEVKGHGATD